MDPILTATCFRSNLVASSMWFYLDRIHGDPSRNSEFFRATKSPWEIGRNPPRRKPDRIPVSSIFRGELAVSFREGRVVFNSQVASPPSSRRSTRGKEKKALEKTSPAAPTGPPNHRETHGNLDSLLQEPVLQVDL